MVSALASNACSIVALQGGQVSDAIAYARQSVSTYAAFPSPPSVGWLVARSWPAATWRSGRRARPLRMGGDLPPMWPFHGPPLLPRLAPRGPQRARERHSRPASGGRAVRGSGSAQPGLRLVALRRRALPRRDRRARGGAAPCARGARAGYALGHGPGWGSPSAPSGMPRAAQRDSRACAVRRGARALRGPVELARALIDLGRRSGARASARRPREHLRRGLHLAHQTGATPRRSCARGARGAGGRPRRDALRGRDALTPSELRWRAWPPPDRPTARSRRRCSSPEDGRAPF